MRASIARSRRSPAGVVRRDAQTPVLESHSFEPTARQLRAYLGQPSVQPVAPFGEPDIAVGLQTAVGENTLGFVRRRKVGVEAPVVPAAFNPDVAGAQTVAQRRDHGRLVGTPVRLAVLHHDGSPLSARERHRHDVRQLALAGPVEFA